MTEQRKTVILTGASRGIGHATVQRFSDEGWRIITCSREDVPEHCKRNPNWSHHLPTDLSNTESVATFVSDVNDILGDQPAHALVNNAAVSPKTPYQERLGCLNGDLDRWREVFELIYSRRFYWREASPARWDAAPKTATAPSSISLPSLVTPSTPLPDRRIPRQRRHFRRSHGKWP